ncbi:MAG TPA: oligosaccharide flippase family protein [Mobilitalea sp.]|nr:oligosaccharide flippase family protein [Mobilitalea sp.]
MPVNKNNSGFVKQAGILIAAGIICRIIGVLYRSPLTGIIGDEGNGYYTSAYNIYTIILLVSSYSIPSASSKVIAQRLALKEYRNAQRIFLCTLIYVIIVGGIASLITFWGAGWLVDENAKIVLRVFAPVIFLSGLLGVLRGYFQAHQTMLQTSVSQIIEQLLNAVVSIGAAYLLVNSITYNKASRAIYGAAGSAIGTGVGVLAALIFMCYIYILNRKIIRKRIRYDSSKNIEPYRRIFMEIILLVTPVIMSTFLYNFNISLNQTIFRIMLKLTKSLTETDVTTMYGIFAGKAVVIVNIPIAIASAISMAMIPSTSDN